MGARVTIAITGVQEATSRLDSIGEKAEQNLVKQTAKLADDGKAAWRQVTPRRKGRLQEEEEAPPSGLSITFKSPTYYYKFVDEGHKTRRRRNGSRSFVKGQEITKKLVDWLKQNATQYISKFLDGV